jgi:hypothetical protein
MTIVEFNTIETLLSYWYLKCSGIISMAMDILMNIHSGLLFKDKSEI